MIYVLRVVRHAALVIAVQFQLGVHHVGGRWLIQHLLAFVLLNHRFLDGDVLQVPFVIAQQYLLQDVGCDAHIQPSIGLHVASIECVIVVQDEYGCRVAIALHVLQDGLHDPLRVVRFQKLPFL